MADDPLALQGRLLEKGCESMIATGWFGVPGRSSQGYTMVHIASEGKPMCGTRVRHNAEFQQCANGVVRSLIDCSRCHRLIRMGRINR